MATLEVRSVPNLLGTPVSYAYAIKAGPWIFLTGHEAFDFERGVPEEVAGPSGFPLFGRLRNRREGDFILQRVRRTLRSSGPTSATVCVSTSITRRRRPSTPITLRDTPNSAITFRRPPRW